MENKENRNKECSQIYKAYNRYVRSVARGYFNDAELCEDIVSMTFTKAFRNLDNFNLEKGAMSTWLGTIARNTCLDMKRSLKLRLNDSIDTVSKSKLPIVEEKDNIIDSELLGEILNKTLDSIRGRSAEYIRKYYFNGWKYNEIAEEYNVPVNSIGVEISRGLKKLKKVLERMNINLYTFL